MELRNLLPLGGRENAGRTKQIKRWVRELWSLSDATTVMVSELQCAEPGCPPRETIIAVFEAGGVSHQSRLHKAIVEVSEKDIRALPCPRS